MQRSIACCKLSRARRILLDRRTLTDRIHAFTFARPPVRPLLYYFEHVSLREEAFRYDQDIQALIANPTQAGEPVTRLRALHCAR